MIHLVLASLIHSFVWMLSKGIVQLEMTEKFGITKAKGVPLEIIPTARLPPDVY